MTGFLRGIMLALLIAAPASAQTNYPDRTVRFIVSASPGVAAPTSSPDGGAAAERALGPARHRREQDRWRRQHLSSACGARAT